MIVTASLVLAAVVWLFSPSGLTGPLGDYAARSARDAAAFATVEVLRLAHSEQEHPRLLLLGTSTIAQAFGDPQALEKHLDGSPFAADWDVHMLATPLQTRLDQLTLIENAVRNRRPDDPPLVIAIGVGIHRLATNESRLIELEQMGRLGVRSDWADEAMLQMGASPRPRSGLSVVENFNFVVQQTPVTLARMAVLRPARCNFASYASGPAVPVEARNRDAAKAWIEAGYAAPDYTEFLDALYGRLSGMPNVHLVLFDERLSPAFISEYGFAGLSDEIYARFADHASRNGSVFIPAMKNAALGTEDYHDDYHIKIGVPQERVRAAFATQFIKFAEEIDGVVK